MKFTVKKLGAPSASMAFIDVLDELARARGWGALETDVNMRFTCRGVTYELELRLKALCDGGAVRSIDEFEWLMKFLETHGWMATQFEPTATRDGPIQCDETRRVLHGPVRLGLRVTAEGVYRA